MAIEGAILAFPLIIGSRGSDAEARPRLKRVALAAGAALALAILSFALNQYVYARARGWREFHEYNFHRSRLSEYITAERLTPQTYERLAAEVGWSNIDFALLRNWFFTDPDLYSLAKVRQAEALFYEAPATPKVESGAARLKRGAELGKGLFIEMRMALLVLGGFVLARGLGARLLLYFMDVLLTLTVLLAGITLALKAPPPRVFWPMLILAATMLTIAARRWERPVYPALSLGATLAVVCVAVSALWALRQESLARRSGSELARQDVERVRRTGAAFFVLHGDAFPYEDYWRPLRVEKTPFPFIGLGVSARTPPVQDSLRRTGRTDLPLSLCSEPGLVLIAREDLPRLLVPFLAQHHRLSVRFEPYFRGERFTAWRCVR